ncbi:hypothetical protein J4407_00025 [Candidatus Pacearchaeota archaeon]|nr:hypothetical protein [Candidatus Pacearchaeota archaeon]
MILTLDIINIALGIGILFLILLIIVVGISNRKVIIEKRTYPQITNKENSLNKESMTKTVIIIGILFFATSIVFGLLFANYLLNKNTEEVNSIYNKIVQNNLLMNKLRNDVIKATKNENDVIKATKNENLENLDFLLLLEKQLEILAKENEDLEDEMRELRREIRNFIAIFPVNTY